MVIEELIATSIKYTLSIHTHVLFLTPRREVTDWVECCLTPGLMTGGQSLKHLGIIRLDLFQTLCAQLSV